jgi:hypothetical protein
MVAFTSKAIFAQDILSIKPKKFSQARKTILMSLSLLYAAI